MNSMSAYLVGFAVGILVAIGALHVSGDLGRECVAFDKANLEGGDVHARALDSARDAWCPAGWGELELQVPDESDRDQVRELYLPCARIATLTARPPQRPLGRE